MPPGTWLNLAVPGAGLLVRGRIGLGLSLILPALFAASAAILAQLVATSTALGAWRLVLVGVYVLLAALATTAHAVLLREHPIDADAVRAQHHLVATAHLTQRHAEALSGAQRLTALAPHEPGAWRLLAVVADSAGKAAIATKARTRATALDAEREL